MAEYHSWNSPIQIGGHKYAAGFLKDGHDVLWIASFWHALSHMSRIASRSSDERRAYLAGRSIKFQNGPEQYSPFTLLPHRKSPILSSPFILNNMLKATIPSFPRWMKKTGWDKPDVLWITNAYCAKMADFVQPKRLIYRMADDLASFDNATEAVVKAEAELVQKADLVLVTSRELVKKVQSMGKEPLYLPNGVDPEFFTGRDYPEPEDLKSIPGPRVIYIGAIDHWFDFEMLKKVAERLPEVSFVIIGPNVAGYAVPESLANIKMLGPRPYNDVPAYLTHSNAAMIPFTKTRLTDNINPIKLYEYFAAGRPVVMTGLEESMNMNPPATFAEGADEFAAGIKRSIELGVDRPEFLDFARANSWQSRYEKVREAFTR